jgi:hypothetical protein
MPTNRPHTMTPTQTSQIDAALDELLLHYNLPYTKTLRDEPNDKISILPSPDIPILKAEVIYPSTFSVPDILNATTTVGLWHQLYGHPAPSSSSSYPPAWPSKTGLEYVQLFARSPWSYRARCHIQNTRNRPWLSPSHLKAVEWLADVRRPRPHLTAHVHVRVSDAAPCADGGVEFCGIFVERVVAGWMVTVIVRTANGVAVMGANLNAGSKSSSTSFGFGGVMAAAAARVGEVNESPLYRMLVHMEREKKFEAFQKLVNRKGMRMERRVEMTLQTSMTM